MNEQAVDTTVLDSGVRIVSLSMPHLYSVSMGVWVDVGARDEKAAESGLSHFIEHMIFKGTVRRSAFEIAKAFDAIGGQTNAFTTQEHTCYYARVLNSELSTMVDILSDIFLNSVFDETAVAQERPVILQEIGMVEDSPEEWVHTLIGPAFWGDHALGRSILGTPENLMAFDGKTLRDFFRRLYQPERIVIAVAGPVVHDRLVELLTPFFGALFPSGNGFPPRHAPTTQNNTMARHRDLEQTHICLGLPGLCVSDSRRFSLSLLNTLLGGNMSSRLFQTIREERGLAYSIYSFLSAYTDAGMVGVYTAVAPDDVAESLFLIMDEIDRFKHKAVSEEMLSDAKAYTRGNLLIAEECPDSQMMRLGWNALYFDTVMPVRTVLEQIDAVTPSDICSLANDLWKTGRPALSLIGPGADRLNVDILPGF
ncbi:insulinase family protein [Desulfosarcina sp. OttesenSCG-928-A07]|nr:insulinase family protein [Desulfosarcina sp. OttesenSCG-928-G17]MDL2328728.1 insulinase family protein [Desulfosarcina sp. OttesenSCG-928-A07]